MSIECARGIVIKENKVVMIYREKKGHIYFSIPGGRVELGETLEQAVIRELLEETSILVKTVKLLGSYGQGDGFGTQHLFICDYLNGDAVLGDADELQDMKKDPTNFYKPDWVPIKVVLTFKIQPETAEEAFKEYLKS